MGSKRAVQVGEEIRQHVAVLLATGKLSDPGLQGVTIQSVKVSPDLQVARIYYSVIGDAAVQDAVKRGFDRARGFIRRSVGERIQMRVVPEIFFHLDETALTAARIHDILRDVRNEEPVPASDEDNSSKE
jgi:ribosome-binding factor A